MTEKRKKSESYLINIVDYQIIFIFFSWFESMDP